MRQWHVDYAVEFIYSIRSQAHPAPVNYETPEPTLRAIPADAENDPWRHVQIATDRHRAEHRCWAYPHLNGRLLSVLVAATSARRILELGTALGYTALSLAEGAEDAHVDTLERDSEHVALARANVDQAGFSRRIAVHQGDFTTLLPTLLPGYDLAFFDGYAPSLPDLLQLRRLLRPGGVLLSANQQHTGPEADGYRAQLRDPHYWLSAPLGEAADMTLSVRSSYDFESARTHRDPTTTL